ncbi:2-oxo-4-hydroxy-4-carboxy-5-ureidoimidazoline decarboxylase [Siculibacillus lacustris]|uniref:2-oxo-4-hydroxy-4-carboxy-5-ureidoimidazoline decarboxylase n=1 Tax=Siculibacillus lacustris TaxID=1549641 RepID=A0A4Q9VPP1_9HYPH|nr:2-oxo-4-hydroxy-4-carboxy-5-ureidoimidazoline decarboxylase [Siculibacillus lacustris]TBW37193.1 2-oxo-4-hydroxy-4-carboxy-5-ureidoimidazoline decarboxylase [Siculibacillus lacustris]
MGPTIDEVNALSAEAFVLRFGDVAEHSPWVARAAAAARPYASREAMIAAFVDALRAAPAEDRLALIRAHPDLAGRAARAGDMAPESRREQSGAGLSALTDAEFARFEDLNGRYLDKFAFPFILAVKGATKETILAAFERRLANTPAVEFAEALDQITRIVRFRLEDRVSP